MLQKLINKILFKKTLVKRKKILNKIVFYKNIHGWLTESEAYGLYKISNEISNCQNPNVLEIGSWKGKSTYCISMGLKKGVVNCIDPFNSDGETDSKVTYYKTKGEVNLLDQFNSNLKDIPPDVHINTLIGYSNQFTNKIQNLDFLFIDGDHSIEGCKFDYEAYEKFIKLGGFLAFHDYNPQRIDLGPTWVIANIVNNNKNYELYEIYDSLCIFKKIGI